MCPLACVHTHTYTCTPGGRPMPSAGCSGDVQQCAAGTLASLLPHCQDPRPRCPVLSGTSSTPAHIGLGASSEGDQIVAPITAHPLKSRPRCPESPPPTHPGSQPPRIVLPRCLCWPTPSRLLKLRSQDLPHPQPCGEGCSWLSPVMHLPRCPWALLLSRFPRCGTQGAPREMS